MNDLTQMIPGALRPWLFAAFLVLFLVVGGLMKNVTTGITPSPFSLEFPWSKDGADAITSHWSEADIRAARKNLALDFVFIVAYVGGLVVGGAMVSSALGVSPRWRGAIAWAAIAAGGLDVIENVGQYAMLAGARGVWPFVTSLCASVKFIAGGGASLYMIGGCGVFLWRLLSARP